jgi:transposase, IS5 family
MREARKTQPSLTESWLDLDHAKELQTISRLLDEHPTIAERVLQDLRRVAGSEQADTGAGGMSAEQVFRALLLKQMNGFSYRQLAYHLADSRTYRTFCRLGITDPVPKKSALARNIKALRPETLQAIHRIVIRAAAAQGIEKGRKVRIDATVVGSPIHHPTDSELLWDGVRKLTDLMQKARKLLGSRHVSFPNRTRRAKRRRQEILNAQRRPERRKAAYRDLLAVTEEVCATALGIRDRLLSPPAEIDPLEALAAQGLAAEVEHFLALVRRVIEQTRRRVLDGESVPAEQKIVSIFEEHTDILRKDGRDTYYGHKICLTVGASSMVLDGVVLRGNPADSTLATRMIDRQVETFGRPPRQATFDGAFASQANLEAIKNRGVGDVAFAKGRGLAVSDMARSLWVYRRLRRFRAGVEGVISFLKRIFGLRRCTWRSWPSFQSYVWSSLLSCNLLIFARHLIA